VRRINRNNDALFSERTTSSDFEVPKYPKTKDEKDFVRNNVALNFLFSHTNEQDLSKITDAFEKSEFNKDDVIIEENENGDYFYLVEFGFVQSTIKGIQVRIATATEC